MKINLLRKTLRRLQRQFDAHAQHGHIIAFLTEQPILDLEKSVEKVPLFGCRWGNTLGEYVYRSPDSSKKDQTLAQLAKSQGFTNQLFDDTGTLQILNEEGQPVSIEHGIIRTLTLTWESYGVPKTQKSGSRREYRGVTLDMLRRIQTSYSIDLGIPMEVATPTEPPLPSLPSQNQGVLPGFSESNGAQNGAI